MAATINGTEPAPSPAPAPAPAPAPMKADEGLPLPLLPGDMTQQMQLIPPGIFSLPPPPFGPANLLQLAPPSASAPTGPFAINKFTIKYYPEGQQPHAGLPPVQELADEPIKLGVKKGVGYVAPGEGDDTMVSLSHINKRAIFSSSALQAIYTAVAKRINDRGIYGVFVTPDDKEYSAADTGALSAVPTAPPAGKKRRMRAQKETKASPLTLYVYVSEIKQIRTISKPVPKQFLGVDTSKLFRTGPSGLDDPRYAVIKAKSPLKPPDGGMRGGLLEKDQLQEYLDRINRFPGRRVDVAITASGEKAGVILDYIVHEEKPSFFAFDQLSNTGTKASGEWRNRFGIEVRQLAKHDDLLDGSFETSLSGGTYSGFGSYQLTPIFPDVLKLKAYGGYGKFTASDVGFAGSNFTGRSSTAGGVLIYTPFYLHGLPIDFTVGAEWRNVDVSSLGGFPEDGETSFVMPIVGVSTDKTTDRWNLYATVQVQPNIAGPAGTNSGELQKMGRPNVDKDFVIGRYSMGASFYVEPLLHPTLWEKRTDWQISTLAHELSLAVRGQYAFDDRRLIPQFEDVIGGFSSVRGYPESYISGDSSLIFNAEYRFHLPKALKPYNADESA